MKKVITLFLILVSTTAFAEGFQVNLQSAKQAGMGHVGTAMKLGAESMHFNPAALVYLDKSVDMSVGVSGVISSVDYKGADNYTAKTDNPVSTPLYAFVGFNIYKDKLAAGLALTTPYGSSLNWGKNWAGAPMIQDIALKAFMLQPTVSVQIIEGLSFGAGLMIATGDISLSKGLAPLGYFTPTPDVVPVSLTLDGKSKVRVGYNLGLMYKPLHNLSIGISYRSKIDMKVNSGTATLDYSSDAAKAALGAFSPLSQATFASQLPLPSNLNFGLSYEPTDRWTVAFDMQFVGWKAYDKLVVDFLETSLTPFDQDIAKNYKNTVAYRAGAQYSVTERFDVRFGAYYDETPVRSNMYNPETPGANKLGITAGFSFEPYQNLVIDFAFAYINGFEREGSGTYLNVLPPSPGVVTFAGKYKSVAFTPSLGVRFKF